MSIHPSSHLANLQHLSRRGLMRFAALSSLGLLAANAGNAIATPGTKPRRALGTTFSQLQCYYLGIDYQETFRRICDLGFQYIRLCGYWHEIEPIEGQYDFSKLDWLLEESHRRGINVVLTVGMKAPRYPEFHFPKWVEAKYDTRDRSKPMDSNRDLADRTLNLIRATLLHTRDAPAIHYWQVENEPFTRLEITGGRYLSSRFVHQEVAVARRLMRSHHKLLLTNAIALPTANLAEDDHAFRDSVLLADAVGINVYTKVPIGNNTYIEPQPQFWQKLQDWKRALSDRGKEAWVAEAQAEPWEPNQLVAMGTAPYPSASPQRMSDLVTSLSNFGYNSVMLWGCEYWYWHQKNGRPDWWQAVQTLTSEMQAGG